MVELASQQRTRLPIGLRRIVLRPEDGRLLTILSNDLECSAGAIAALYRKPWQIELPFRWIKQHLKIQTFLGRSENAIRLQILAAIIDARRQEWLDQPVSADHGKVRHHDGVAKCVA